MFQQKPTWKLLNMKMIVTNQLYITAYNSVLPPSQNVSKNWSTKVNVCGSIFVLDISTYVDQFLLTF